MQSRQELERRRNTLWTERLTPIAFTLIEHGIRVDAVTCSRDKLDELINDARPHINREQRSELRSAGEEYATLTDHLRTASEQLGTTGGALLAAREFPGGRTLSEGDSARGTPHNLDRVILLVDQRGTLVAIEEKGAASDLGGRWVDNPADPGGPRIRAEQCSPEYLRHMLQHDTKLSETLRSQPELRAAIQAIINGADPGKLRYVLVKTSISGRVTATDYVIDDERLGRRTIRLAGSTDAPEDR